MNDFNKNVSGREGWIGVSPIERDKKDKEEFPKELKNKGKPLLFAGFIVFLKKCAGFFSGKERSRVETLDRIQLTEDLLSFRKMLQILAMEDQSHNPEFTQQLSELWHNLTDTVEASSGEEMEPALVHLSRFVEKIHDFPPGEDHSLGYYLTEYAGKEWLPFPFMDILHQLYQQNQENPQGSELSEWISSLYNIVTSLDERVELN